MITIRLDSPVPLMEQIIAGLRAAIAVGELSPGDPLPTVRQLAADLGVNQNTVARAYRERESAGLAAAVRGRGTVVTSASESPVPRRADARRRLAERLGEALSDAKLAGLGRDDVAAIVTEQLRRFWAEGGGQ